LLIVLCDVQDDPLRAVRAALQIMQRMVNAADEEEDAEDGPKRRKSFFTADEAAVLPSIGVATGLLSYQIEQLYGGSFKYDLKYND
jgi:hypothetical protein